MKDTKDKIEIKFTKKVKFWLSFILGAIIVAITTTVLVIRYNYLNSTPAPSHSESSGGGGSPSHPERNTAETDPLDPSIDLSISDTTSVLVTLSNLGNPYTNWFGKYLSSTNVVSQTKLDLSNTNFAMLEAKASEIVTDIHDDYTAVGKTLTIDTITDSDNLITHIQDFKELLNNIEK